MWECGQRQPSRRTQTWCERSGPTSRHSPPGEVHFESQRGDYCLRSCLLNVHTLAFVHAQYGSLLNHYALTVDGARPPRSTNT